MNHINKCVGTKTYNIKNELSRIVSM